MGKMKSRKTAVKRFKITKTGKMLRRTAGTSHIHRTDDTNASIRKRRVQKVSKGFSKRIKKMMKRAK